MPVRPAVPSRPVAVVPASPEPSRPPAIVPPLPKLRGRRNPPGGRWSADVALAESGPCAFPAGQHWRRAPRAVPPISRSRCVPPNTRPIGVPTGGPMNLTDQRKSEVRRTMTALDQAFIKAFSQQVHAGRGMPPRQAAPAAKQPPLLPPTPSTACWRRWKSRLAAPELHDGGSRSGRRAEERVTPPDSVRGKANKRSTVCRPLKSAAGSGHGHRQWAVGTESGRRQWAVAVDSEWQTT